MRSAVAILLVVGASAWADDGHGNYDPCGGSWSDPGPAPPDETADPHKTLCTEAWATAKSPSATDTATCAHYFAREVDFSSDAVWKVPAAQIAVLIQRIDGCKSCDADAKPWLVKAARLHFDLVDPVTNESIEPQLDKALAGNKLVAAEVGKLASVSLWKLRNAPYARHGRPFKTADLQTFYYGDRGKDVAQTKLLPLKPNPKFTDALLDKTDDANVSVVMAEIHKRGEK